MPRQFVLLLALLLATGCDASRTSSQSSDRDVPEAGAAPLPGQAENTPLPAVSLPDLAGTSRPLRAEAGEVTVLNFWATWCVPCLEELPDLVALDRQWSERGVRVVGISIDSGDPADIRAFAEEHGMEYTLLMADQQWARKHFGVFGLPVTLVVDREGNIRRRMIGPQTGAQFEAAVQALLRTQSEENHGQT
jgi:peroxiredoxin